MIHFRSFKFAVDVAPQQHEEKEGDVRVSILVSGSCIFDLSGERHTRAKTCRWSSFLNELTSKLNLVWSLFWFWWRKEYYCVNDNKNSFAKITPTLRTNKQQQKKLDNVFVSSQNVLTFHLARDYVMRTHRHIYFCLSLLHSEFKKRTVKHCKQR